jgi:hypothetical protein
MTGVKNGQIESDAMIVSQNRALAGLIVEGSRDKRTAEALSC